MSIKLEMLRCFCTVVQTGNLAEAADRLGRTQSAVSMTLKQLEEHIGKRLFRGERKNQLSPLGEQVFRLALKQVRLFDETIESIGTAARASQGMIRIASVPSVATIVFPAVLEHMTRAFPGLKIELRDTDTQHVLDALSEGRADIGIGSGYHPLNGVRAVSLFSDRFGLVAASDHPLVTAARPPELADVAAKNFVLNSLCLHIQDSGFHEAVAHSNVTVHNTHSLIAMVKTGRWVTVLPETVARFLPESTTFRPLVDLTDTRQVFLYIRERPQFMAATKECSDFIQSLSLT